MLSKINFNYRVWVFAVLVLFSLINLLIAVTNHYCYRSFAFDYAAYNFAFFDFAHLRVSAVPIYMAPYPITFLQDHFSFTLVLLSPLYWLMAWLTGTYTLLVIQWLFVVAGAVATYKLAVLKSGSSPMGLLSLVYFFVLFGRYSAADADCNLAIIGAAAVPVFLYFFEAKKIAAAGLTFVFLILTREDYSLWLIFISLFLLILHRKNKPQAKQALVFLIASLIFLVLVFKVFIPGLEDEHKKYTLFEFGALGKTPFQAIAFIASHPLKAIELLFVNHSGDPIFDTVKAEFYIIYLLSGAFILFTRPLYVLPFVPLIAKKMYADSPIRWSVESYYSVEVVSILPVMVFMVLCSYKNQKLRYWLGGAVCLLAAALTVNKIYTPPKIGGFGGSSKYNFMDPAFYHPQYNIDETSQALAIIGESAAVSASGRMAPHLAFRPRIYFYPKVDDARYIFLFKAGDSYPLTPGRFAETINELRQDPDWKIVLEKNDFILFERPVKN